MPFKIGSDTIGDIYVGSDKISKIYVGSNLFYTASSDDLRFNYVGIDANGKYEGLSSYDGTAVAYGIGKLTYTYYRYTQVSPTPTTASDYSSKYVYDTETDSYTACSYNNETLSPSWVVVGTTPCYTRVSETYYTSQTETQTFKYASYSTIKNGAFNTTYWGESIKQRYNDDSDIPEITELKKLALPTTYRGMPVTQILAYAFYGHLSTQGEVSYYPAYQMKKVLISSQSITVVTNGFFGCSLTDIYVTSSTLNFSGLDSFYSAGGSRPNSLILDASVTSVNGPLLKSSGTEYGSIVFKHAQSDSITLSIEKGKNASTFNYIYTDCDAVRNYDWAGQNVTVNFKTLSEYTGDLNYED